MHEIEVELFLMFCLAHLKAGLTIGIQDYELFPVTQDNGDEEILLLKDGDMLRAWKGDEEEAVQHLRHIIKTERRSDDNVVFYSKDRTGVTWRFLKIDMPFLNIVVNGDQKVFQGIVNRLSSLMRATLEADQNPELN